MYNKVFYFIEVTLKNGNKMYFGKGKKLIPLGDDNLGWYLKEYGYDTGHEAFLDFKKIEKYLSKLDYKWHGIQITESKVQFKNYEQYLSVCH